MLTATRPPAPAAGVGPLRPDEAGPYAGLAREDVRELLLDAQLGQEVVRVGASFLGRPVGLALGMARPGSAELLDVYVAPAYRNQGLGRDLLAAFEQGIAAPGCRAVEARAPVDRHTPAFEATLRGAGWTEARRWRRFRGDISATHDHWWRRDPHRVPPEVTLTPWLEVSDAERDELRARGESGWFRRDMSPLGDVLPPESLDPLSSMALRLDGRIVGWILCQRWAPDVAYVATLFVGREARASGLKRTSLGTALVGEATERHLGDGVRTCLLDVDLGNHGMLRWAERFVSGACPTVEREWRSWRKEL